MGCSRGRIAGLDRVVRKSLPKKVTVGQRSEDCCRYLGETIYVSNEEQQEVQKHQLKSMLGMWTIQHRGQSGRNQWQGTRGQ